MGGAWGGEGPAGAGPGAGRGLAAQKLAGGAERHVREEGARCTGSPGMRSPGGGRACLPAHVCVIFEMECGTGGAAGAWGRPRRRRDAVRPAPRGLQRAQLGEAARLAALLFPHSRRLRPRIRAGGEARALPQQLRRRRAPASREGLPPLRAVRAPVFTRTKPQPSVHTGAHTWTTRWTQHPARSVLLLRKSRLLVQVFGNAWLGSCTNTCISAPRLVFRKGS